MSFPAQSAILLVASLHVGFMILEMFLWDQPAGLRVFGHSAESARRTKVLAANQGLYNGFLAAGLFWSLWQAGGNPDLATFFLGCVLIAGLYGAFSASRAILWVQAAPAALALGLLHLT